MTSKVRGASAPAPFTTEKPKPHLVTRIQQVALNHIALIVAALVAAAVVAAVVYEVIVFTPIVALITGLGVGTLLGIDAHQRPARTPNKTPPADTKKQRARADSTSSQEYENTPSATPKVPSNPPRAPQTRESPKGFFMPKDLNQKRIDALKASIHLMNQPDEVFEEISKITGPKAKEELIIDIIRRGVASAEQILSGIEVVENADPAFDPYAVVERLFGWVRASDKSVEALINNIIRQEGISLSGKTFETVMVLILYHGSYKWHFMHSMIKLHNEEKEVSGMASPKGEPHRFLNSSLPLLSEGREKLNAAIDDMDWDEAIRLFDQTASEEAEKENTARMDAIEKTLKKLGSPCMGVFDDLIAGRVKGGQDAKDKVIGRVLWTLTEEVKPHSVFRAEELLSALGKVVEEDPDFDPDYALGGIFNYQETITRNSQLTGEMLPVTESVGPLVHSILGGVVFDLADPDGTHQEIFEHTLRIILSEEYRECFKQFVLENVGHSYIPVDFIRGIGKWAGEHGKAHVETDDPAAWAKGLIGVCLPTSKPERLAEFRAIVDTIDWTKPEAAAEEAGLDKTAEGSESDKGDGDEFGGGETPIRPVDVGLPSSTATSHPGSAKTGFTSPPPPPFPSQANGLKATEDNSTRFHSFDDGEKRAAPAAAAPAKSSYAFADFLKTQRPDFSDEEAEG